MSNIGLHCFAMAINMYALYLDSFYSFDNVRSSFMKRHVMLAVILALCFVLLIYNKFKTSYCSMYPV